MVQKAYNKHGVDFIELVIEPLAEDTDDEAEYVIKAHVNFLLSNWSCIYGRGCAGMFGDHEPNYNDDAGCCVDSFYFSGKEDFEHVEKMMGQLTDEDWDKELRANVEKHGWYRKFKDAEYEDGSIDINGKGRVLEGACVFANRNGGSSGKPGCAFHHMGERTGQDHTDVMPEVCWALPIRFVEVETDVWELGPWDISQWHMDDSEFNDFRYTARWWCMDTPDAFIGTNPVYKSLEKEIRKFIGDRPYELLVEALEARIASGNTYAPMPGAIVNDGRPLLPLLIGNRTPRREPSYLKAFYETKEADANAEQARQGQEGQPDSGGVSGVVAPRDAEPQPALPTGEVGHGAEDG